MNSIANPPTDEPLKDQPGVDERRALIERVAASTHFRRSARLRDFLLYVGGQSLKDGCPEINEQEIGVKVFGRPSSYDRSQDNIVRVNATELRKRIELYFTSEGAHESLILEIPRGGYKPIFHHRLPETPAPETQESGTHDRLAPTLKTPLLETISPRNLAPVVRKDSRNRVHIVWGAMTLALAIVCLMLFQQNRNLRQAMYTWDGKPAVATFWTDFVHAHPEIDIVLPDASVSLSEDIVGHPMSLSDYLDHGYMRQAQSLNLSSDRINDLNGIFAHNLVTMGDFHAAQQILALTPLSPSLHLTFSRFYTADSVKRNSFILIGGKKANPWVRLFDDQMNFSLDYDNAAFAGVHCEPPSTTGRTGHLRSNNGSKRIHRLQCHRLPAKSQPNRQRDYSGRDRLRRYQCGSRVPDVGGAVGEISEHSSSQEVSLLRGPSKDLSP